MTSQSNPETSTTRTPGLLDRVHLSRRGAIGGLGAIGLATAFTAMSTPAAFALSSTGIQKSLWGLYYYDGVIDGNIGSMTKTAIRKFQADRGLVVDGYAGSITQAELNKVVKQVQAKRGLVQDGDYGKVTVASVKKFQSSKGLVADGRAGAKTMAALGVKRVVSGSSGSGKLVLVDQMSTGTYSSYNCGPSCMVIAMVAIGRPPKGYVSDPYGNAAPVKAARTACGYGSKAGGLDITWLQTGLSKYGVTSKKVTFSAGLDAAAKGKTVIFNVNHKKLLTGTVQSGDYGHYVVSNGRDSSGRFRVSDPGRVRSLGITTYTRTRMQYAARYNRAIIVG